MIAKLRFLFWIGIVTIFVPYIGITNGIRTIFTILIGVLIIYLSIKLRKGYKELRFQIKKHDQESASVNESIGSGGTREEMPSVPTT
ncbi:MAG TPA: hypothetical protein VG982_01255 [Candidatus Paceibacterota bacterium]|jgi:hypothetical protein|nr:hypothetical protein [Candidatus Paceibacterota bacterium]